MKDQLSYDPTTVDMWECIRSLRIHGVSTFLIWVPGHADITGNELADASTKEAPKLLSRLATSR